MNDGNKPCRTLLFHRYDAHPDLWAASPCTDSLSVDYHANYDIVTYVAR